MIRGRQITLHRPKSTSVDGFNNQVIEWEDETIENVLIEPLSTTDLTTIERANGDKISLKIHLPKTYNLDTRGCECTVDGYRYKVIGAPTPYMQENTPTKWNYPIEVERIDG